MKLFIKLLNENAREFYESHGHFHQGDAGLDLYMLNDITIGPGETKLIKLGISCQPDNGKAYYLIPRSSIFKTPLRMANSIGLIDAGYRGEIMVPCDNIKDYDYNIKRGQRLFQLVGADSSPITYEIKNNLTDSTRGEGGFGSTGK